MGSWDKQIKFDVLSGDTITRIDGVRVGSAEIIFHMKSGKRYEMSHDQDCCESVHLEQIHGDPESLVGSEIVWAAENSNVGEGNDASSTWTYYTISTMRGPVSLRWLGASSGYYSEDVSFYDITPTKEG